MFSFVFVIWTIFRYQKDLKPVMFNNTDDSIADSVEEHNFEEKKNYTMELEILIQDVKEKVFPEAKKLVTYQPKVCSF